MKCVKCKKRDRFSAHFNCKYCDPCRIALLHKPAGRLTKEQAAKARKLIHKMPRDEIAKEIGVSVATLKRWARDNGNIRLAYFNKWVIDPDLVKTVCEYYAKHGMTKTQKKFPNVKLRSVIERYAKVVGAPPRQIRWKPNELLVLVKMAGIISKKDQAIYFSRPRANKGSITSAWMKKFKCSGSSINGLSYWLARRLTDKEPNPISTQYWYSRRGDNSFSRRLVLWVDLEKSLRADLPDHIKDAVKVMAKFQRWLHGRKVKNSIGQIRKEVARAKRRNV